MSNDQRIQVPDPKTGKFRPTKQLTLWALLIRMLRAWDYTPAHQLAAMAELLDDAGPNGVALEVTNSFCEDMKRNQNVFEAVRFARREWDL